MAMLIGGIALLALNMGQQAIAHVCASKLDGKEEGEENVSFMSARGFLFLHPKKSSPLETIWCFIVAFGYGVMMTYAIHPVTFIMTSGQDNVGMAIVIALFTGMSGHCILGQPCPETAIYRDNEQEFGWGSNHYQRPLFFIIIAGAMMISESAMMLFGQSFWHSIFIIIYFL